MAYRRARGDALEAALHCYICRERIGAVQLARCTHVGPDGECGRAALLCRVCERADADELEHARERWQEEHPCPRPDLHILTVQRYLERGLADLHSARVRFEEAGQLIKARELSGRLLPLEELYASLKAENEQKQAEPA